MRLYQLRRLPYYVIHDPLGIYDGGILRAFQLAGLSYAAIDPRWIGQLGLGLTMWDGTYQGIRHSWLRWCDRDGVVLPTGEEAAERSSCAACAASETGHRTGSVHRRPSSSAKSFLQYATMSEYQYYEFQALDRPLSDADEAALRKITSPRRDHLHEPDQRVSLRRLQGRARRS